MSDLSTINGLSAVGLLGRGSIGYDVVAAICKYKLSFQHPEIRLSEFDLNSLEAGVEILASAQRGVNELENPTEYSASMEDSYNYRDIRKILVRKGFITFDELPNFQNYIRTIRDIRNKKPVPESDATIIGEIFKEFADSAKRMHDVLCPVSKCS